jgi:hypothetical protein
MAFPSRADRLGSVGLPSHDQGPSQADLSRHEQSPPQVYLGRRLDDDVDVAEGIPGERQTHRNRAFLCPDYAQSTARAVMTTPRVVTRFTADPSVISFRSMRYQAFAPGGMGVGGLLLMGLAG